MVNISIVKLSNPLPQVPDDAKVVLTTVCCSNEYCVYSCRWGEEGEMVLRFEITETKGWYELYAIFINEKLFNDSNITELHNMIGRKVTANFGFKETTTVYCDSSIQKDQQVYNVLQKYLKASSNPNCGFMF